MLNSLGLCMIVRDEEATLGRCLDSVAGVFDQIVVADTGSTDATRQVAESRGATVVEFGWIDDFAAARNFAFAHGTADHLMWLDADDVVSEEDRAKLIDLKRTADPGVDAVSMLYDTAFDDAGNLIARNRRIRIVRRSAGFSWAGVVHEDLVSAQAVTVLDTDIVITHRKPDAAGPADRNLRILERLIASGAPVRPIDVLNYARELEMHKRFGEAVGYYEQFLATGDGGVDVHVFALHKLASCYYMDGRPDKEWECTLRSLELDAPRPEFSCRLGERFVAAGRFDAAAFWYRQALEYPGSATGWAIESLPFRTWLPHKQLGLCYYHLGDYRRSLEHNRMAQQMRPDDPEIVANIGLLEGIISGDPGS